MGVNGVTGDYSRGAAGFWIEKGEIAFPVSEMTVAGNLKDIFARLVAADDLEFKTGADSPTLGRRSHRRGRLEGSGEFAALTRGGHAAPWFGAVVGEAVQQPHRHPLADEMRDVPAEPADFLDEA